MSVAQGFLWVDIAGTALTSEDKEVLAHPCVSGIILFAKNFESVAQLQSLTRAINAVSPELIITVDQEGGRVQRFLKGFTKLPSMSYWGRLYAESPDHAAVEFKQTLTTMVKELRACGIYATLSPVLDIDYGHSEIIGERSFGRAPELVAKLGALFVDTLHALNMPVVGKHFPGHGFVHADSHLALPVDERAFHQIAQQDLLPFAKLAPRLDAIMPAHIVYEAVDDMPACFSRFWLQEVLRKQLGFDGLIISDDLTMQGAASLGDYPTRSRLAIDAGVDVLTVCNNRAGVVEIIDAVKKVQDPLFERRFQRYLSYQRRTC